jgi:hypothetical protein
VWLREKYPDASIATTLVEHERGQYALVRAQIITSDAGGSATGYGSETVRDFGDYLEKAETKAIGRALAALGFGTQFAPDMDDGSSAERPVDAPVTRGAGVHRARHETPVEKANRLGSALPREVDPDTGEIDAPNKLLATQRKRIYAIAHEVWPKEPSGFDPADVNVHDLIGRKWHLGSVNDLTEAQAKAFIDYLDTLPKVPLEARRQAAHQQGELVTAGVAKAIRDYTS